MISRKASIYNPQAIVIGSNVRIDDFCMLSGGTGIHLGNYIHVSCFCGLYGGAGIVVEDFCTLSARVTVFSESDDFSGMSLTNPMIPRHLKPAYKTGPVLMKRHTIIGTNTTVLPGVTLGVGVSVGAHSLVTNDCEEWTIYAGNPAKKLKPRSKKLLDLEREFLKELSTKHQI